MDGFISTMENRLNVNALTKQTNENNSKPNTTTQAPSQPMDRSLKLSPNKKHPYRQNYIAKRK